HPRCLELAGTALAALAAAACAADPGAQRDRPPERARRDAVTWGARRGEIVTRVRLITAHRRPLPCVVWRQHVHLGLAAPRLRRRRNCIAGQTHRHGPLLVDSRTAEAPWGRARLAGTARPLGTILRRMWASVASWHRRC